MPAAARGPITGYTCLSAETSFQRIDEVTLLLDGRELARIDDPEKANRLTGGATICLDTAQIPNGDHGIEFAFKGDGGLAVTSARLATDNPPFRLTGAFPARPTYRDGETIEMNLEATHPRLTVAVDFSKIDSRYRKGAETVVHLPGARYLVRYTLSRNNSRAVGLYPVSILVSLGEKSRLYAQAVSLGLLPRRDVPLSLLPEIPATQIFGPMPHATRSALRILSLASSAPGPVRIGQTTRITGVVGTAAGTETPSIESAGRALTVFFSENRSDGFYRMPVELLPCSGGPPGCLGRFTLDLELTAGGAASLAGLETLNLLFGLEDSRGGIAGPASLPVPAEPVLATPPPPGFFHLSGKFLYRTPNPVFQQNGPNDIDQLSELTVEKPVRFAIVQAVRDADGVVLASTRTNKYGDFAMDFLSPIVGLVHASAYTHTDTGSRKIRVFDSDFTTYKLSTAPISPNSSPTSTWSRPPLSPNGSSTTTWPARSTSSRSFAGKSLPKINVLWDHGYSQGRPNSDYVGGRDCSRTSYYSRSEEGGQLHLTSKLPNINPKLDEVVDEESGTLECVAIPGEFMNGDLDDDDTPVQVHEFGHFLQHRMTRAEACTHGVDDEPRSAWCEGAPTAIGQTILGSPFYYDRTFSADGVESLSVQNVDQNTGGSNNQAEMPVCGPYPTAGSGACCTTSSIPSPHPSIRSSGTGRRQSTPRRSRSP